MKLCVQDAGLYSCHGYKDAYKLIREAGFEAIDWNIDVVLKGSVIETACFEDNLFLKSDAEIDAYFAEELAAIREAGLIISQAHAPFPFYRASFEQDEKIFDLMVKVYEACIRLCDRVGCKNLVIHGTAFERKEKRKTLADIDALNKKMYTSLIPTLKETNVTVCLENLFTNKGGLTAAHCSNPYDAAREIDELNALAGKECFGFCLDTGHLNLLGLNPLVFIPILGKRIKALHIHDNDGITDIHKAPYTGTINWIHFYTALKEIGYDGDLDFETFNQTDPKVIERELTLPWFKLIAEIGAFFRKKIQE